jgi:hypothetical protein
MVILNYIFNSTYHLNLINFAANLHPNLRYQAFINLNPIIERIILSFTYSNVLFIYYHINLILIVFSLLVLPYPVINQVK